MKRIEFNEKNHPKKIHNRPKCFISFSRRGRVTISGRLAEVMDLIEGERVSIAQDEEAPENWYVFKSEDGFVVNKHTTNEKFKGLRFFNTNICKTVLDHFDLYDDHMHTFKVSPNYTYDEGDRLFPILFYQPGG